MYFGEAGVDEGDFHRVPAAVQTMLFHVSQEFFIIRSGVLVGAGVADKKVIVLLQKLLRPLVAVLLLQNHKNLRKSVKLPAQKLFPGNGDSHLSQKHHRV